jgi:hypothetical protein
MSPQRQGFNEGLLQRTFMNTGGRKFLRLKKEARIYTSSTRDIGVFHAPTRMGYRFGHAGIPFQGSDVADLPVSRSEAGVTVEKF